MRRLKPRVKKAIIVKTRKPRPRRLGPAIMRRFLYEAEQDFGVTFVTKSSKNYETISNYLVSFGIRKPQKFLEKYSISMGSLIWLSFTPGAGTTLQLINQIATICHELKHTTDFRRDRLEYAGKYAFSKSKRTYAESRAFRLNIEIKIAFGRRVYTDSMANSLGGYRVRKSDIATCKKNLRLYYKSARGGKRAEPITKWACEFWRI